MAETTTHQFCCPISSRRHSRCPTMTGPFWPNTLLRAYRRTRNGLRNWNVGHAEPSPIPSAETHRRWWHTGWRGASHADEEAACVCAVSRRCHYTSTIRIWRPTIALAEAVSTSRNPFWTFEKSFWTSRKPFWSFQVLEKSCASGGLEPHAVKHRNQNPVDYE